jgi:diacylglycerol kinase (ATP)
MRAPLGFNPRAGHGRGARLAKAAQKALALEGVPTDAVPTFAVGDASPLVERLALEGHERILVLGGDGTLSEAADGALRSGRAPMLGFLPGGTGNSFLRDFDLLRVGDAAARIARSSGRFVDAARVEWDGGARHFINNLQTGFGALVADITERRLKRLGSVSYAAAVPLALRSLSSPMTRLELDGEVVEEKLALIAICNSKRTGGAMLMAPLASMDDGLLDVVALREVGRGGLLRIFPKIFDGSHMADPKVFSARAKDVRIAPAEPSRILGDGELFGATPLRARVLPRALRLLA